MKPKHSESEKPQTVETQTEENQSPSVEGKGGEPSPAGLVDLDTIASDLSDKMPEVQEHVIEQEKINEDEKLAQFSHLKDRDGNGFDPAVHKTNKNGEPTLSPKGLLIKKPGRKPGQQYAGQQKSHVAGGGAQSAPIADKDQVAKMQARASGTMAANLVLQIGIVAGGQEWQPRRDEQSGLDEKVMLESAFADYFEATGKTDIPPGMALTVAVGAYALPRFTMPQTQTRLQKAKTAIKQWWVNRKLKKHGLKASPIKEGDNSGKMEA